MEQGLFSGSGLGKVDGQGLVRLPPFVRQTLARRPDSSKLVFAAHESAPCMIGYDRDHESVLYSRLERRRLLDEAAGIGSEAHHARARRRFGIADEARYDDVGAIQLPELVRRRAGIDGLALFVGTGGEFEIWDPQAAREAGDDDLRELAEYWLGERTTGNEKEDG